jgi:hypothetical protein
MQTVVHLAKATCLVIIVLVLLTFAPVVFLYAILFINLRRLRGLPTNPTEARLAAESSHQETKIVALRSFRQTGLSQSLPRERWRIDSRKSR